MTVEEWRKLSNGLKGNTSVKSLIFADANIVEESAMKLVVEIISNKVQGGKTVPSPITHLDVSDNLFGAAVFLVLVQALPNTSLTMLNVANNRIGDGANVKTALETQLQRCTTLKEINISNNGLGEATVITLIGVTSDKLTTLNFDSNSAGVAGGKILATALARLTCTLLQVSCRGNRMGSAAASEIFAALALNKRLLYIDISENDLTSECEAGLAKLCHSNRTLKTILCTNNPIGGSLAYASQLSLTSLHLGNCRLDLTATMQIAGGDITHHLQELDLSGSIINAEILEQFLRCKRMTYLCFDQCNMEGQNYIIALERNLTPGPAGLKFLSLNNCGLGDEGAKAFARILTRNHSLQILRLSANHISLAGMTALAGILKSQPTLQRLSLDYNDFTSAVLLANALLANTALKELSVMRDDY